jgi:serine-type D-Ala-D-Ala carboxypeptidase/endopeptidase
MTTNARTHRMFMLAAMRAAAALAAMRAPAPLAAMLAAAALAAPATAQEAAGNWAGALQVTPEARLPLLVHIQRDEKGGLTGTLDSPSQGAVGLPLAEIIAQDARLSFAVPSVGGTFAGEWVPSAKAWRGTWSQSGAKLPLVLGTPPPPQPLPADWQLPPDEAIAKLIADRNAPRPGQGIVIGLSGPEGARIVAGGTGAAANVDRTTLFEIGSISKVFTGLILADMVNKGQVSLDDPAEKYLPAGHHMPRRGDRPITLRDLSTHRSGLPRMADDLGRADGIDDPFAGYGEDKLLAFLDRYQLTREPGAQWEYSNLGAGLLGYLLGRAAHSDYETLLRERITGPLGMKDTMITLKPADVARLAAPFDRYMRPAKRWDMTMFAPAGGIRSTAADMLTFARAVLDPASPVAAAVKTALGVRVPGQAPQAEQALGWIIAHPRPDRTLLMHDGQTGGYQAILALEPAKGRAVVALSNSQAQPMPTDLALHILLGGTVQPTPPVPPAPPPPSVHTEIALPTEALEKFVGRYKFDFGVVSITRGGDSLLAQRADVPGAPALPIYPETPTDFFWKALDAQIGFTLDASGKITGAALTQSGATMKGTRVAP